MATDQIHCEILRRAAEVAGGEDQLAQRLNVRSEDMREWGRLSALLTAGPALDTKLLILLLGGAGRALPFLGARQKKNPEAR
jgi:hypothetical protein